MWCYSNIRKGIGLDCLQLIFWYFIMWPPIKIIEYSEKFKYFWEKTILKWNLIYKFFISKSLYVCQIIIYEFMSCCFKVYKEYNVRWFDIDSFNVWSCVFVSFLLHTSMCRVRVVTNNYIIYVFMLKYVNNRRLCNVRK